ncbi:hypothetical protein N7448_001036 [Penicillium atrosanguineum]|nr:hypothetical protein N7526_005308 [Penicillium atrosanguineum]KAJ5149458.1 hypothetical protein N7448_001036 [Penicillium atrosanguineum]
MVGEVEIREIPGLDGSGEEPEELMLMQPLLRAGCKLLLGTAAGHWEIPIACVDSVRIDAELGRGG